MAYQLNAIATIGFVKKSGGIFLRCYVHVSAPDGTTLQIPIRAAINPTTKDQINVFSVTINSNVAFLEVPIYGSDGTKTQIQSLNEAGSNATFKLQTLLTVNTTYNNEWDTVNKYNGTESMATTQQVKFSRYNDDSSTFVDSSNKNLTITVDYNNGNFSYRAPAITRSGYRCVGWQYYDREFPVDWRLPGTAAETTMFPLQGYNQYYYPIWEKAVYTLNFDPNGGSLGSVPSSMTYELAPAYTTLPGPCTRTGYRHAGWSLNKNEPLTGDVLNYGTPYQLDSSWSDKTFYAIWQKQFKIIYDGGNVNNDVTELPAFQYANEGTPLILTTDIPKSTGYVFKGWSKSQPYTTVDYEPGDAVTFTADTTLNAVWEGTITYDTNGSTNTSFTQTFIVGNSVTITSDEPTRSGYTFKGWAKSSSATVADYQAGDTATFDADTTLYAVWGNEAAYPYEVTNVKPIAHIQKDGYLFLRAIITTNAPPGTTLEIPVAATMTMVSNIPYQISVLSTTVDSFQQSFLEVPVFLHKEIRATVSDLDITDPAPYYLDVPYTVGTTYNNDWEHSGLNYKTAQVSRQNKINVYFHCGDGHFTLGSLLHEDAVYQTINYEKGSYAYTPQPVARNGYKCIGWTCGKDQIWPSDWVMSASIERTMFPAVKASSWYPVWKENLPTYTLTYNPNGGSLGSVPATQIFESGSVTLSSYEPTRSGYRFDSWSDVPRATISDGYYPAGSVQSFTNNITLYAQWKCSVYYHYNHSQNDQNDIYVTKNYFHDEETFEITVDDPPTRSGYTFKGWAKSRTATSGQQKWSWVDLKGDTHLYAIWEQDLPTYTLTYNANGGSLGNVPATQTFKSGSVILSSYEPTRAGCEFIGWGNSPEYDGYSTPYGAGTLQSFTSNKTIYAQWAGIVTYRQNFEKSGNNNDHFFSQSVHQDKFPIILDEPTRDGYTFKGWSKSSSATTAEYGYGMLVDFVGNLWLYAVWERNKCTLTFDAGEGSIKGTGKQSAEILLPQGDTFKSSGLIAPIAELDGKHFVGWYDANNVRFEVTTQYEQDITFTACYTDDNLYGYFPLIIGGKPVAVRPYIVIDGKWVRACAYVYSASKWNPTCCPSEYGYGPPEGLVAHMPRVDAPVAYSGNTVSPTLVNYHSSEVVLTGNTSGVAVGSYILRVTPKAGYTWEDGSRVTRDVPWQIS